MTDYALSGQESGESGGERRGVKAVAKRVHRALDSFYHVEAASDDGKYVVFSGSGETYTVTLPAGECTCPDGQRGAWCKHAYRVAFVTSEIPDIDGVRAVRTESDGADESAPEADNADTEQANDDTETLTERVERFEEHNPGASAIEAISQLGINPDKRERVEEVLA